MSPIIILPSHPFFSFHVVAPLTRSIASTPLPAASLLLFRLSSTPSAHSFSSSWTCMSITFITNRSPHSSSAREELQQDFSPSARVFLLLAEKHPSRTNIALSAHPSPYRGMTNISSSTFLSFFRLTSSCHCLHHARTAASPRLVVAVWLQWCLFFHPLFCISPFFML